MIPFPISEDGWRQDHPQILGTGRAFLLECVCSVLLILVIVGTSTRGHSVGPNAALAVGSAIIVCTFLGGPFGGGSMNPARSLAPGIISNPEYRQVVWIYIVAPVLGAMIAVGLLWFLKSSINKDEYAASAGLGGKNEKTAQEELEASTAKNEKTPETPS